MISAYVVLLFLHAVQGVPKIEPLVHWSMDLFQDLKLTPDYGDKETFTVEIPSYLKEKSFADGVIGRALSLSGNKVNLIENVEKSDCIGNPIKCENGLSIAFWLFLKKLTRDDYQVILRSTNFDSSEPGVYIGGDEDPTLMRFLLRTAEGTEHTLNSPWSVVKMKWCHFVLNWNSSTGIEIFLNGSRINSTQYTVKSDATYPTGSSFATGDILGPVFLLDDLWIFYNYLPQDTIFNLYALGLPARTVSSSVPIGEVGESNKVTESSSETTEMQESSTPSNLTTIDTENGAPLVSWSASMSQTTPKQVKTHPSTPRNAGKVSAMTPVLTFVVSNQTKRMPVISIPPTTIPYTGWFYNQTWYHTFLGLTLLALLTISVWLYIQHCCVSPMKEKPKTGDLEMRPFINT